MEKLVFISYEDLINDIKKNLCKLSQYDFDLVVGVPRSGMIPAYLISAFLNLDCTDIDSLADNRPLQKGITRNTKKNLINPFDAQKILIVDDSIYSGESMEKALEKLPAILNERLVKMAVYSSLKKNENVDLFFEFIEGLKLFEWGIFHNNLIDKTCIDIDGVICEDPLSEDNDDGEKYLNFIRNSKPKFIPTGKVFALVSNRLEKYRVETEIWLKKHNVDYHNLVLLDLPTKQDRLKIDTGILHKGDFFKRSKAVLFIESSFNQSISIAKTSGKPVYCVDRNIWIQPELADALLKNSRGFIKMHYYSLKHSLKPYLGWLVKSRSK
jgi:uncharacterized HAD superfamily protein/adenine/guanine phosphoribosyltransferase-like PRPP-binding protein